MPSNAPRPSTTDNPQAASRGLRLIVLAGQHEHVSDPLSTRFAASHRCLVPLGGKPLIAHVLQTGAHHPRVDSLAVCIEREAFDPVWDVLTQLPGRGSVALIEAKPDLAESVLAAAQGWDGPLLITTADHALLSEETIDSVLEALDHADLAVALAPRECVETIDPSPRRHYIRLRDGAFAPCDLYGVADARFLEAAKVFRGKSGSRRVAVRIAKAVGLIGLLMIALGLETLPGAIERAARHWRMRIRAVISQDGTQAVDVGNDRSYAIVRDILEQRESAHGTIPVPEPLTSRAVG